MTLNQAQRSAQAVITADRQLHYAQRNLSLIRELGRDDMLPVSEELVTDSTAALAEAIAVFRDTSDLTGIYTEDGAVLRAFLIVAETIRETQ